MVNAVCVVSACQRECEKYDIGRQRTGCILRRWMDKFGLSRYWPNRCWSCCVEIFGREGALSFFLFFFLEVTQPAAPESQKSKCVSLLRITCSLNVMQITKEMQTVGRKVAKEVICNHRFLLIKWDNAAVCMQKQMRTYFPLKCVTTIASDFALRSCHVISCSLLVSCRRAAASFTPTDLVVPLTLCSSSTCLVCVDQYRGSSVHPALYGHTADCRAVGVNSASASLEPSPR